MLVPLRRAAVAAALALFAGPAPAADPVPAEKVEAEAWVPGVTADPAAGLARYKGKVVEVTGRVGNASPMWTPEGLDLMAGERKATEPYKGATVLFVDCVLPKDRRESGWALAYGQKVKVVGVVAGVESYKVRLTECVVTEVEKNPLVTVAAKDVAAAYTADPTAAGKKYGRGTTAPDCGQFVVEGTVAEVKDSPWSSKLVILTGDGRIALRCAVTPADAERLKPGDVVRGKVKCDGLLPNADGMIVCSGHLLPVPPAGKK